jgi:acyl carrier protein
MKQGIQSIEQRITDVIHTKMGIDKHLITPQADLMKELGMDSLDTVELIVELEKEFEIIITDEEVEKIIKVKDIIAIITNQYLFMSGNDS